MVVFSALRELIGGGKLRNFKGTFTVHFTVHRNNNKMIFSSTRCNSATYYTDVYARYVAPLNKSVTLINSSIEDVKLSSSRGPTMFAGVSERESTWIDARIRDARDQAFVCCCSLSRLLDRASRGEVELLPCRQPPSFFPPCLPIKRSIKAGSRDQLAGVGAPSLEEQRAQKGPWINYRSIFLRSRTSCRRL